MGSILIGGAVWLRQTYWPNLDPVESRLRSDISRDLPPGSSVKSVESFMDRKHIPYDASTISLVNLDDETAVFTPKGAKSFQFGYHPIERHFPYDVVQYQERVCSTFWFDKKGRLIGSHVSQFDLYYGSLDDDELPPRWAIWVAWKLGFVPD